MNNINSYQNEMLPPWVMLFSPVRYYNYIMEDKIEPDLRAYNNEYSPEIDTIVDEYNSNIDVNEEKEISLETKETARDFMGFLIKNNIDNFEVVPSPLGEICFEWTFDKISMGIAIGQDKKLIFEYLNKIENTSEISTYDLTDSIFKKNEILSKIRKILCQIQEISL